MKRTLLLSAVALLCLSPQLLEAQRGGGGGRRGGGAGWGARGGEDMEKMRAQMEALQAFPIDAMWTAISFGMDLSDQKLMEIRPMLQHAWKQRNDTFAIAREDDTWKAAQERLEDLRKQVEAQLENQLTEDQWKQLKKLQKDMRKNTRFPGRSR